MEKYIFDGSTGEHIQRKYTTQEKVLRDLEIVKAEAEFAQRQAEAEAQTVAKAALLERLGITEAEAKLLLA